MIHPPNSPTLPRKVTRIVHPRDIETSFTMRGATNDPPNSPNTAPATQNDHLTCGRNLRKTGETSFPMRGRSENDPSMIRPWKRKPQPASQVRLLFELPRSIFYCKIQRFEPNLTFKHSPSAAPATKSNTWPSPNTAPTTKSNTWTSPNTAPTTKSNTWPSPSTAPATKSDIWTSPTLLLYLTTWLYLTLLYLTLLYLTLLYLTLLYLTLLYLILLYLTTLLDSTLLDSTLLDTTLLDTTLLDLLYLTLLYLTLLYLTLLYYSTWLYSTWLYSTWHYSTWHYSTWLYSTWFYSTWLYSTWPTLLYLTLFYLTLLYLTYSTILLYCSTTLLDSTLLDTTLLLLYLTLLYLTLLYLTLLYLTLLYLTLLYLTLLYLTLLYLTLLYLTYSTWLYLTLLYLTLLGCRSYIGSFSSKLPLIISNILYNTLMDDLWNIPFPVSTEHRKKGRNSHLILTRWIPTRYKWGYNSTERGEMTPVLTIYFRPFIGATYPCHSNDGRVRPSFWPSFRLPQLCHREGNLVSSFPARIPGNNDPMENHFSWWKKPHMLNPFSPRSPIVQVWPKKQSTVDGRNPANQFLGSFIPSFPGF